MEINAKDIKEMVEIVYELVRHGLTFKINPSSNGWKITLDGGF
jgi:secreted Zn-dependent insulinase-like peptidase